jgi:hypothetical protein
MVGLAEADELERVVGKQLLHGTTDEDLGLDAEAGGAVAEPGADGVVQLNVEIDHTTKCRSAP